MHSHNTKYGEHHHRSRLGLSYFRLPSSHFGLINIRLLLLEIEKCFNLMGK